VGTRLDRVRALAALLSRILSAQLLEPYVDHEVA